MSDYVEQMFSYREPPWHGKGQIVDNALTAAEAIKAAGLDWEVELRPVNVAGIPIQGSYATVRTDTQKPLGIVGSRYCVYQNDQLFSFFDPVIDEKAAIYHTGGSLKGGTVVWLLAKLDQSFYVLDDDKVEGYVLLVSSHDGSIQITAKTTPIRVVCWNTLSAALIGAGTSVSIKHTANAEYQLRRAHAVLGIATNKMKQFEMQAKELLSMKVGSNRLSRLVNRVFPTKHEDKKKNRHLQPIELLYAESPGILPGMRGTGWAAYNAITEYLDFQMPTRGEGDPLYRSWISTGETLRARALDFLLNQTGDR